jgi:hypothetical protein
MFNHLRSAWLPKGEPFNAPSSAPAKIDRIVIHYIGTARAPRDSQRWMLQTHRETMSRPVPFAHMYNAHISLTGETWEGRGVKFRNAANGSNSNATTWSIVFAVDGQNEANPAQVQAARKLIRDYRNFLGRDIPLIPHKVLNPTRCPGDGITAQIHNRIFEEPKNVTRIAGSNRYETAVEVSKVKHPQGAPVVYVASGRDFSDALSAATLATNGPLLITDPQKLPEVVKNEIRRLKASRIVIVGGESAVSSAVAAELATLV